jgi:hypothetical protein
MEPMAIILGVSGILLLAFAWPAWRRECRRRIPEERHWECSTINAAPIAHRLERVRSDYVATLAPLHAGMFHEELLSATRRAVSHLSFFRHRRGQPHNEHDDQLASFSPAGKS